MMNTDKSKALLVQELEALQARVAEFDAERRQTEAKLQRREQLLHAVNAAAQRFLKNPNWRDDIDAILELVGTAATADRVTLFDYYVRDDVERSSLQHEWVRPGLTSLFDYPAFQDIDLVQTGSGEYLKLWKQGQATTANQVDFVAAQTSPEMLQAPLMSLLTAPVMVKGRLWGQLNFESAENLRDWSEGEQTVLMSAAGILGTVIERQQSAESLRENEERFRLVIESMEDIVFVLDTEQRHIGIYGNWVRRAGWTDDMFLGKTASEIMGDDAASVHISANEQALNGQHVKYEWSGPGTEGLLHYQTALSPLRDDKGTIVGLVGVGRDITERIQAEDARKESESMLRATLDGLSAHIALLDERGDILLVNKAWREFAKANGSAPEMVSEGGNYLEVCNAARGEDVDEATMFAAGIRSVLSNEFQDFAMEYPCHSPDEERWFVGRVTPFPENGERRVVVAHENITERKRAEHALHLTQHTIDTSRIPILWVRPDASLMYANQAMCQQLGYTPDEVLTLSVSDFDLNWSADYWVSEGWERLKSEGRTTFESTNRCKDGTVFPVEVTTTYVNFEGQECVFGFVADITDRKESQHRLKQSEERLRSALEGTNTGLHEWYPLTNETYFSPTWFKMLGYEPNEFPHTYETWATLLHPEDRKEIESGVGEFLAQREPNLASEIRMKTKGGPYKWIFTQAVAVDWNDAGEITRTVGTFTDITERKKAEEARLRSEARFRAMFENADIGLALVNLQGGPVESNRALQEMLSYSAEELRGMQFSEFTHPEDVDEDLLLFQELMEGKRSNYRMDKRYIRKDGTVIWGHLVVSLIRDAGGNPEIAIGMVQNISERKQAEEALKATNNQLQALIDTLPDRVITFDEDGRYLQVHTAGSQVSPYAKSPVGQRVHDLEIVPKKVADIISETIRKAIESDALQTVEYKHEDPTGIWWTEGRAMPLRNTVNGKRTALWLTRDITERKQAEEALRESEQKFREFAELSFQGIYHYQYSPPVPISLPVDEQVQAIYRDGVRVWCNTHFAQMYGRDREELIGGRLTDTHGSAVSPDNVDWIAEWIRSGYSTIGAISSEVDRDGNQIWFSNNVVGIVKDGFLSEAWGTQIDITERKRAQEALAASNNQLQALIDTLPDRIITFDEDGRYLFMHQGRTIGGNYPESPIGQRIHDIDMIPTNIADLVVDIVRQAIEKDALQLIEYTQPNLVDPSTDWWTEGRAISLHRTVNGRRTALWVTRDITDRKQAEKALRESNNQLQALINTLPDRIVTFDEDGRYLFMHTGARMPIKYQEDPINQLIHDMQEVPEHVADLTVKTIRQAIETATLQELEYSHQDPSNPSTTRWAEGRAIALGRTVNGKRTALWVTREITDRKQAEAALQESNNQLQALINALPDRIVTFDEDGRYLFMQAGLSAAEDTSLYPESPIGELIHDVETVPKDSAHMVVETLRQAIDSDNLQLVEYTVPDVQGPTRIRWLEGRALSLHRTVDGKRTALWLARDITERKQAEATLKRREAMLKAVSVAAENFLKAPDWRQEIEFLLEHIGKAAVVDRVSIWRVAKDQERLLRARLLYEWFVPGLTPLAQIPQYENFDIIQTGYGDNLDQWNQGETTFSHIKDLEPGQRKLDHLSGLRSVLETPILADGILWGVLAFETTYEDRDWSQTEIEVIQTAANILAATIEREQVQEAEREQRELAEALAESALAFNVTFDMDEAFKHIFDFIKRIVPHEMGAFLHLVSDAGHYDVISHQNAPAEFVEQTTSDHIRFGEPGGGLGSIMLETKQPAFTTYTKERKDLVLIPGWEEPHSRLIAPVLVQGEIVGALILVHRQPDFYTTVHTTRLIAFANQVAVAYQNARLYKTVEENRTELQHLSARIINAQEEERARISQDLHDEVGQVLTAVQINLAAVERALPTDASSKLRSRLEDTAELSERSLELVRDLSLELRPSLLDDLGLVPTLRWYTNRFAERLKIDVNLGVELPDDYRLSRDIETALYRMVQEALTNTTKHAQANAVRIELRKDATSVHLTIADDGQGFVLETLVGRADRPTGLGLIGIRERVTALSGHFEISSVIGQGTRLEARVPLD